MLVVFAGLALILATSASAARSGLRGLVVLSPSRPVCVDDDPCTRPAARVVLAFSRHGRVVARVRTDADGRYRVRLPAGVFRVTAPDYRVGTGVTPRNVRVPDSRTARVDLQIDTGIQ
jgi:hypothetical protein